MPQITPQILKSVDFTKTQKSRYLESETLFFLQIKKLHIKGCFIAKISFVAEVTLKKKSFVVKSTTLLDSK